MNNKYNFYKISKKKETFQDNDYKMYNGFQIPSSLNLKEFKGINSDNWKNNLIKMCNIETPAGNLSPSDRIEITLKYSLSDSLKNAVNNNNFNNLPDSDINFICDCLQNLIVQRNAFLDDIKKNIQSAYDNDNTINNLQDQKNIDKLAKIINDTITSSITKYNYICSYITIIDFESGVINFLELIRFINSYETIDINFILNLLDLLKHIEIVILSCYSWIFKTITSDEYTTAKNEAKLDFEKNENELNYEKNYVNVLEIFKNKIFIPYLNNICPNNTDCGILYDILIKLPGDMNPLFYNSTFKQRMIKIFNLNYKTISAIHNIFSLVETLEPSLVIETYKSSKNNTPINFLKSDLSKKIISTFKSYLKNLIIELNQSTVVPVFVPITTRPPLTNRPPASSELNTSNQNILATSTIINGIPDINIIGGAIFLLLLLILLLK
jgi:hypothetical protein